LDYNPIDVESKVAKRLPEQFKSSKVFSAIVNAMVSPFAQMQTDAVYIVENFGIGSAVGNILDALGSLVGTLRQGRTDEDYRSAIISKLAVNNSTGTLPNIIDVTQTVTGADEVEIFQHYPAMIVTQVGIDYPLNSLHNTLTGVVPVGVQNYLFRTIVDEEETFITSELNTDVLTRSPLTDQSGNIITVDEVSDELAGSPSIPLKSNGYVQYRGMVGDSVPDQVLITTDGGKIFTNSGELTLTLSTVNSLAISLSEVEQAGVYQVTLDGVTFEEPTGDIPTALLNLRASIAEYHPEYVTYIKSPYLENTYSASLRCSRPGNFEDLFTLFINGTRVEVKGDENFDAATKFQVAVEDLGFISTNPSDGVFTIKPQNSYETFNLIVEDGDFEVVSLTTSEGTYDSFTSIEQGYLMISHNNESANMVVSVSGNVDVKFIECSQFIEALESAPTVVDVNEVSGFAVNPSGNSEFFDVFNKTEFSVGSYGTGDSGTEKRDWNYLVAEVPVGSNIERSILCEAVDYYEGRGIPLTETYKGYK
jgi:hypothetical protein